MASGAEGSRTLDLLNAIQALSQLSYGPTRREESERRRAYSPMIATGQPNSGRPAGGTLAPSSLPQSSSRFLGGHRPGVALPLRWRRRGAVRSGSRSDGGDPRHPARAAEVLTGRDV